MGCQYSSEEKKLIQTIHYTYKNNNLQINKNNIISLNNVNQNLIKKKEKKKRK